MSEKNCAPYEEDAGSVASLHRALDENSLAHAILLHGQNLTALEELALALSAKLLGCKADKVKSHLDFFSLRPINKMRQINAEKTRELIKSIFKSPQQSSRKVCFIYEADRMNKAAANAFLKTLEEPPLNTNIFLLTSRPYSLLDTIRSRCLNFRLPSSLNKIQDPAWEEWLKSYEEWTTGALHKPKSKSETSERLLAVYRMTLQFESISQRLSDESWNVEKNGFIETLTEEEEEAQKSGAQKHIRFRLFSEIQLATHNAILRTYSTNPPIQKLDSVIKKLESTVSLTEVNLNPSIALESFLLHSLRTWPG